jgi:nucleotide-binding universal stress UspA family protein
VIAVPAQVNVNRQEPGHTIMVAYDGSLQAARALHAFETSGLAAVLPIVVVSVHPDPLQGCRIAERAIDYLRFHDIKAEAHPVTSRDAPARVILDSARSHKSELIVMGGYGQPVLREFFLGSVTRNLLGKSPVPLFLYH